MDGKNIQIQHNQNDKFINLYPVSKASNIYDKDNKSIDKTLESNSNLIQSLIHKFNDLSSKIDTINKNTIKFIKTSFTLKNNSSTADIGHIVDPNKDLIIVFQNSIYIELNSNYKLSKDNKQIISTSKDWVKDTMFNFIIIKNGK